MKYYILVLSLFSLSCYGQEYQSERTKLFKEAYHNVDSFFTKNKMAKDSMVFLIKNSNDKTLKTSLIGILRLEFRSLDGKSSDEIYLNIDHYSQKITDELILIAAERAKYSNYK